jgi:nitroreductase
MQKPAITQVPIDSTIANRWSGRAYDAVKPVSHAQVLAMLEAARWAPSCFGDEPWRFIVWNKSTDATGWQQAFDCLMPGNQSWAKDAQVLVLVCADTLFGHNQQPNRFAQYDTGAAAENLCLQATALGLMTHQMGGYNADLAREKFHVPPQYMPMAMITVGYPADIAGLTGDVLTRETSERKRKPISSLFFTGQWGQGI